VLEQALQYAQRGWSVIPLHPRGKKPMLSTWRDYQQKPADEALIRSWWTACPEANIALLTGRVSGLVVVDFDGYDGNPVPFLQSMGQDASTPIVVTGKGFHVYYRHPGGEVQNGARIARIDGVAIDIRGDGGYVVAPPSIHESGRQYEWLRLQEPELLLLPETFRRGAVPQAASQPKSANELVRATSEIDRILQGVGSGERNAAAAKVAGYYLRVCASNETAALTAVRVWNRLNQPPLDDRELETTFESIARRHRITGGDEPTTQGDAAEPGVPESRPRLTLLSGSQWADAVREYKPRHGVAAPSWPGLEEVGGIVPKDLLILAGRPGMGKSTCAWGVAADVAIRQKVPTLIFSTEMTAGDVARWLASFRFRVDQRLITPEQWNQMLAWLSRSPITICDAGTVKVTDIVDIVRQMPEVKLVIIDHIQRLVWGENRNQAIEAGAAMLKSLAKDGDCTVLALSQLNRSSSYDKRRPQLHDLRDSGGLEQEADAVCFLWSDADDITALELPVKFWWAKNRHGALTEKDAVFHKTIKRYIPTDERARVLQSTKQSEHLTRLNAILAGDTDERPEPDRSGVHAAPGPGEEDRQPNLREVS
jgi:KaiC/GvpD/RAD55 family RecA-like ATPase